MSHFDFNGAVPASKSMLNRAFNLQSYEPQIQIDGDSGCDDVRHMKLAIAALIQKKSEMNCGDAGTVLRFMSFRVSRENGTFHLKGSSRLMARPQSEIVYILEQLGVQVQLLDQMLTIRSQGWKKPLFPIKVHREASSQFASALLLNAWNLPFDLEFEMKVGVSEAYWQMTLQMVRMLGLAVHQNGTSWKVPKKQTPKIHKIVCEPDYSSAFAIAGAAALCGRAVIQSWTDESLQADRVFPDYLTMMGAHITKKNHQLIVEKAPLKSLEVSLANCPDLFPVLACLCVYAKGVSTLRGAPHLKLKESNRILKTKELLEGIGIHTEEFEDGLRIYGRGEQFVAKDFYFDVDHDHRMAMAAGILKLKGAPIRLSEPQVVSKSFPEFWQVLGVKP